MLKKIVGGGQTGVDRAALEVGLALGLSVGGGCPRVRRVEDRRIADQTLKGRVVTGGERRNAGPAGPCYPYPHPVPPCEPGSQGGEGGAEVRALPKNGWEEA